MLFNTIQFWVFFALVLAAFYSLPLRGGKWLLLVASYFFYMCWDPRFAMLIAGSTVVDYLLGVRIAAAAPKWKKRLVVVSVVANLGVLGFFKYCNFFIASFAAVAGMKPEGLLLNIVLPVGISFYTFKSMSYTIDVARGQLAPVRNFWDFAAFVAFFPELVAGPIVRAEVFLPQWFNWKAPTQKQVQDAIMLMGIGMIKKMVFADRFAVIADQYFGSAAAHPGALAAWTGAAAFALQIYFDFSGYTDIARGAAALLGFQFPLNFARPYLSANITEFWKRWHMSLSQWLRDYLYIPLGGNRHGTFNTYRNLMLTMLLGGLWHGASWNFVIWGGFHGILLVLHRLFVKGLEAAGLKAAADHPLFTPLKVAVTFGLVTISWVFFRAGTLPESMAIIGQMLGGWQGASRTMLGTTALSLAGLAGVVAILEERQQLVSRLHTAPAWLRASSYVAIFFCLELFAETGLKIPFIYFQF